MFVYYVSDGFIKLFAIDVSARSATGRGDDDDDDDGTVVIVECEWRWSFGRIK